MGRPDQGVRPDRQLGADLYAAAVEALGSERDREPLDLKVSLVVDAGEPVDVLAGAGRERPAALIVTGTRGRSVLSSALLGSVSVGVVRTADRPVALVPASAGDAPKSATRVSQDAAQVLLKARDEGDASRPRD